MFLNINNVVLKVVLKFNMVASVQPGFGGWNADFRGLSETGLICITRAPKKAMRMYVQECAYCWYHKR